MPTGEPLIPPGKPGGGKRKVNMREVANGRRYVLSTRCRWRAIPKDWLNRRRRLARIGRNSGARRSHSCASFQSAPCSENAAIPPQVCGQALKGLRHVFKLQRPSARYELLARFLQMIHGALFAILVLCTPSLAGSAGSEWQANDPRDDRSPGGVAPGAECFPAYLIFNPMLEQAGVRWLRGLYEWQMEPAQAGILEFCLT
jgi:hypothetical protein